LPVLFSIKSECLGYADFKVRDTDERVRFLRAVLVPT
jgi:hypothetical protein